MTDAAGEQVPLAGTDPPGNPLHVGAAAAKGGDTPLQMLTEERNRLREALVQRDGGLDFTLLADEVRELRTDNAGLLARLRAVEAERDQLRLLADYPLTPTGSKLLEQAQAEVQRLQGELGEAWDHCVTVCGGNENDQRQRALRAEAEAQRLRAFVELLLQRNVLNDYYHRQARAILKTGG